MDLKNFGNADKELSQAAKGEKCLGRNYKYGSSMRTAQDGGRVLRGSMWAQSLPEWIRRHL